ncbi:MAG: hypothetical protein ACOCP9_03645, partial [Halofilum sp. (in: g-proteobacteria)]
MISIKVPNGTGRLRGFPLEIRSPILLSNFPGAPAMAQSVPDQSDGRAHVSPEAVITLATKVAFLSRPGSYPGAPETVDAIETRLSWVFLTPDRAWKLKKPVRYD